MWTVLLAASASSAELHVGVGEAYTDVSDAVNAAVDDDVVVIHQGTYADRIFVGGRRIAIVAAPGDTVTLESDATFPWDAFVIVQAGAELSLQGLVFDSGHRAIDVTAGAITVEGCTFTGANVGAELGGAVRVRAGSFTARSSSFVDNEAYAGGAIFCEASCTIEDSGFDANKATTGAHIHNATGGDLRVGRSTLCSGDSSSHAGAIRIENGSALLHNNLFFENDGGAYGGALHSESASAVLTTRNNVFAANTAFATGKARGCSAARTWA